MHNFIYHHIHVRSQPSEILGIYLNPLLGICVTHISVMFINIEHLIQKSFVHILAVYVLERMLFI